MEVVKARAVVVAMEVEDGGDFKLTLAVTAEVAMALAQAGVFGKPVTVEYPASNEERT